MREKILQIDILLEKIIIFELLGNNDYDLPTCVFIFNAIYDFIIHSGRATKQIEKYV